GICDEWGLITRAARAFYADHDPSWSHLLKVLLAHGNWWEQQVDADRPLAGLMNELLSSGEVTTYLGLNEYEGAVWFSKERFEELRWWLFTTGLVSMDKIAPETHEERERLVADVVKLYGLIGELERAERASGYKVDVLLEELGGV
ncbi:MAG: hypothetical protein ACOC1U_05925, partial [Spirochaetota bacterium]